MTLESAGVFLQGVGTVLLSLVTAVIGWRAAGALRLRIDGPIKIDSVVPRNEAAEPKDEFADTT